MMQREQNKHKEAEGRKQEEKENLRKCKATSTQPIWFFEKINKIDKPLQG